MNLTEVVAQLSGDGGGGGGGCIGGSGGGSGGGGVSGGDIVVVGHEIKNRKPRGIRALYNEFFGIGDYKNVPVAGGLSGLESRFGKDWRDHFLPADNKFFLRMKMVAEAVNRYKVQEVNWTTDDAIEQFDAWFVDKRVKRSLSNFVLLLQETEIIPKRGRKLRLAP